MVYWYYLILLLNLFCQQERQSRNLINVFHAIIRRLQLVKLRTFPRFNSRKKNKQTKTRILLHAPGMMRIAVSNAKEPVIRNAQKEEKNLVYRFESHSFGAWQRLRAGSCRVEPPSVYTCLYPSGPSVILLQSNALFRWFSLLALPIRQDGAIICRVKWSDSAVYKLLNSVILQPAIHVEVLPLSFADY